MIIETEQTSTFGGKARLKTWQTEILTRLELLTMDDKLKLFCQATLDFTSEELKLVEKYFEVRDLKRKEFLHHDGKVCNLVGFIAKGSIRHFHIKDGVEKTCDLSFENSWVTDFTSFTNGTPGIMNLQAMEDTVLHLIRKDNLYKLYSECRKYETFGRLMVEKVAQRATDIAMSLSSEKPQERFHNLINTQPDLFQRVPQRYIANFLGVSPESLSRIKSRISKT